MRQADVFISYAREDATFVAWLRQALEARGHTVWTDQRDILPVERWRAAVERGVREASLFVAILSPESLASQACRDELAIAVASNKRIAPARRRDVDEGEVPDALAEPNWLLCGELDDRDEFLAGLIAAIETDLEDHRGHAELLVAAALWDSEQRPSSRLLRGSVLERARDRIAAGLSRVRAPRFTCGSGADGPGKRGGRNRDEEGSRAVASRNRPRDMMVGRRVR